jgi:hypothetical protein
MYLIFGMARAATINMHPGRGVVLTVWCAALLVGLTTVGLSVGAALADPTHNSANMDTFITVAKIGGYGLSSFLIFIALVLNLVTLS